MREFVEPAVLGELLGLLVHDLRNPLSALHSNLHFIRSVSDAGDADLAGAIEDGFVSCDGLGHLIDNLELLGRLLRPARPIESAGLLVSDLVHEVVSATKPMAQSHRVEVVAQLDAGVDPAAEGVRSLLASALGALVRNSVQHSPPGSQVVLSLRSEVDHEVVVVTDQGGAITGGAVAFTPAGQVAAKSGGQGRYSRGFGLYAAALAASAGNAALRTVTPESGGTHAFELLLARGRG